MKKYLFAASVILLMIMGSAFVMQDQNKSTTKPIVQEWFIFDGLPGEENDPSKYHLETHEPDCPEGTKRCAVYAQRQMGSNPVVPNLSQSYDIFTKP